MGDPLFDVKVFRMAVIDDGLVVAEHVETESRRSLVQVEIDSRKQLTFVT